MPHGFLFYAVLGFLLAQFSSFLTTIYLHRGSTHRSVVFNPVLEFFMQFGLWLTTGINRKEWVAVHLCHHAYADKDGDPHSPLLLGFWRVQLGNLFLYQRAAKDPKVLWYGKNIKPTLAERTIFSSKIIGLAIGIVALWVIFGFVPGTIIAVVHTALYLFVLNNLVNGWCHARGYKNFPATVAFNNRLIALFTAGEGLHNNHHYQPGNPSLRQKQNEVDLGWVAVSVLCFLRLAKTSSTN